MAKGVSEFEIRFAILDLMVNRRVWSNAELKASLARSLPLTAHDRGKSNSRDAEARWEIRVNNALSPSRPNSLHASGWVESTGHGEHIITNRGYDYANSD